MGATGARASNGSTAPASLGKRLSPGMWSLGSRLAGLGASAAIAVALSRFLGPDGFGQYVVATSVAFAGSIVAAGGLNRVLLRETASALARDRPDVARVALHDGLRSWLVSCPVGVLLTALVARLVVSSGTTVVVLAALLAGALGLVLVASEVLRGLGDHRLANAASGLSGGALVAFILLGLVVLQPTRPSTPEAALALNLVAATATALLAIGFVVVTGRRVTERGQPAHPDRTWRALTVAGLPFVVIHLANFLNSQVDLWIAGGALSEHDTGLYAAAFRLVNLVRVPLDAATLTLAAVIPALFAVGRLDELQFRLRRAATFAAGPAALALGACVVAAGPILALAFGSDYRDAAPLLILLASGQLVTVLTGLAGITMMLCGRERVVLAVSVTFAVLATVSEYAAAKWSGAVALAATSAVMSAGAYVIIWLLARARLGLWTHPLWPRPSTLRGSPSASDDRRSRPVADPGSP